MSNGAMMSVPWWACSYWLPIIRGAPKRVAEGVRVAHREHEPVDHDLRSGREHGQVELRGHARSARLHEADAGVLELEASVDEPLGDPRRGRRSPRALAARYSCTASSSASRTEPSSVCAIAMSFGSSLAISCGEVVRTRRARPRERARASNCRRAASTRRTAARSPSASPVTDCSSSSSSASSSITQVLHLRVGGLQLHGLGLGHVQLLADDAPGLRGVLTLDRDRAAARCRAPPGPAPRGAPRRHRDPSGSGGAVVVVVSPTGRER